MTPEEIKQLIENGIPGARAQVSGDGHKFEATVISDAFEGLTRIKEHQLVYGTVNHEMASGELHALTIHAYTPQEWEKQV